MAKKRTHGCGAALEPHCASKGCTWWKCSQCKRSVLMDDLGQVRNEIKSSS